MKAFGITERSYFHVYGVTIPFKPVTWEQPVSYPSFFLPLWVEHPEVRQDAEALLRTHGGGVLHADLCRGRPRVSWAGKNGLGWCGKGLHTQLIQRDWEDKYQWKMSCVWQKPIMSQLACHFSF